MLGTFSFMLWLHTHTQPQGRSRVGNNMKLVAANHSGSSLGGDKENIKLFGFGPPPYFKKKKDTHTFNDDYNAQIYI